jgi:tetratricopeptide (TPR) repeat protein
MLDTHPGVPRWNAADIADFEPGDRVGPFRLCEPLGEGGFGVVFRAEQDEPVRRSVALKIVKLGMDTKAVIGRFEAERQALALMEHPNIARVVDAGATESGRPFFAMELVDGVPITDYCEEHELDTKERLALFRTVCDAVQHAHQKGVIHRDLKPSNVLVGEVDGRPVPKVIDFGIAKATGEAFSERSCFSTDGQLLGTPAYMSPEQAAGSRDIDTRTDVYSLGVLLYELLAGAPPFSLSELGFAELQRAVRESDPPRPSTQLRKAMAERSAARAPTTRLDLPTDLDWIVLRALEKSPARRYPTAYAFGLDVARFLDDRPVEAAPPGLAYRVFKLARRHRVATVAGLVVLVALVLGGATAAIGLVEARRANAGLDVALAAARGAKARAEEEAERARAAELHAADEAREARRQAEIASAVNDFLTDDLLGAVAPSIEPGRGRDVRMRDVLDVAAASLAGEGADRFADAPLVEAAVRGMIGRVYLGLGEFEASIPHLERAADLRGAELGPEHEDTLRTLGELSGALRKTSRLDESDAILMSAFQAQRESLGLGHEDTVYDAARMARNHLAAGRTAAAVALCEEVLAEAEAALGEEHEAVLWLLEALGQARSQAAEYAGAEDAFGRVLEIRRRTAGNDSADTANALGNLARSYMQQYRRAEAEPLLREALAIHGRVYGPSHPTTITAMNALGFVQLALGRVAEAEELQAEALRRAREELGPEAVETLTAALELGRVYEMTGQLDRAEPLLREAHAGYLETRGPGDTNTLSVSKNIALLCMRTGRLDEARELLETALDFESEALDPWHPNLQRTRLYLGQLFVEVRDLEEAERVYVEGLQASLEHGGPPDATRFSFALNLGRVCNRMLAFETAEPHLRDAVEWGESLFDPLSIERFMAHLELGVSLGRRDAFGEAEPLLLEAFAVASDRMAGNQSHVLAAHELARLYRAQGRDEDAERFAPLLELLAEGEDPLQPR